MPLEKSIQDEIVIRERERLRPHRTDGVEADRAPTHRPD